MSQFGWNTDTVTDGCTLLSAITNTQFVMSFVVSWKGLNLVKGLNVGLQSRTSDIIKAYRYIDLTKQSTQKARDEIDRVNEEWFTVANSMAESVGVDNDSITIPHTCGRQQNRVTLQQKFFNNIPKD